MPDLPHKSTAAEQMQHCCLHSLHGLHIAVPGQQLTAAYFADDAEALAQAVPALAQLLAAPSVSSSGSPALTGASANGADRTATSAASPGTESDIAADASGHGRDDVAVHLEALHALTLLLPAPSPQVRPSCVLL